MSAEKYEDPLEESLASSGAGALTGGGAMLSAPDADGHREIEWCGVLPPAGANDCS
ncbi:MAG TPA: hypothetical protein VIB00_18840 [Pyrinomonadaceae bacterium]